jgi:hypothetical protein
MMTRALAASVAVCAALAAPVAACPDYNGNPYFGTIGLGAGFQPDPQVRGVTAGGTNDLARCGLNAAGYVTSRPDFRLQWSGASAQLTIAVESGADVILLVNDPSGGWHYSDDYRGTNSAITFFNPAQGQYDIWIGSYDGSRRNPANLIFTEYNY